MSPPGACYRLDVRASTQTCRQDTNGPQLGENVVRLASLSELCRNPLKANHRERINSLRKLSMQLAART